MCAEGLRSHKKVNGINVNAKFSFLTVKYAAGLGPRSRIHCYRFFCKVAEMIFGKKKGGDSSLLFPFNGIRTFACYLMSKPFLWKNSSDTM